MLQIVCRQRDRFKSRIADLEEALKMADESGSRTKAETEQVRKDNIKLYQKVRYLESYHTQPSGRPGSGRAVRGGNRAAATPGGDIEEQRYQQMFEASIDPFQEFSHQAISSKFKDLNVAEKCTFYTGKFMTANKYTRTFIFFYTVSLHLLVYSLLRY